LIAHLCRYVWQRCSRTLLEHQAISLQALRIIRDRFFRTLVYFFGATDGIRNKHKASLSWGAVPLPSNLASGQRRESQYFVELVAFCMVGGIEPMSLVRRR
jgi:hypothetical protein